MGLFLCPGLIGSDARNTQPVIERIDTQNFSALDKERFLGAKNDILGEERFAGKVGGTDRIAATALGAGVAVQ